MRILAIVCVLFSLVSEKSIAQTELQRKITGSINYQKLAYTDPLLHDYFLYLETSDAPSTQDSAFYYYSKARYLFEVEQKIKKEEKYTTKYKNFDAHFEFLIEAKENAILAAEAYERLDEDEKSIFRKSITATDGEIKEHLRSTIEQEAFYILKNAQYRKPTRQLYQSRIYRKTVDADTLMAFVVRASTARKRGAKKWRPRR